MDPQLVRERTQISQPLRGEKRGNPTRHVRLALGVHGSTCRLLPTLCASGSLGVWQGRRGIATPHRPTGLCQVARPSFPPSSCWHSFRRRTAESIGAHGTLCLRSWLRRRPSLTARGRNASQASMARTSITSLSTLWRLAAKPARGQTCGQTCGLTCMQLSCMHASHEYNCIQKHTALAKSGEARSVTCDVSHICLRRRPKRVAHSDPGRRLRPVCRAPPSSDPY